MIVSCRPLFSALWLSLTVIRAKHRIPPYLLPEEGLYFPPLLAADIENPGADVTIWMGNEAILRALHAEGKPVGWTTVPDGGVSRGAVEDVVV